MRGTPGHSAFLLSGPLGTTPPPVGCPRSGGHSLCTACFILRLPASVSTQTPRAADVGSTCASVGTRVYV